MEVLLSRYVYFIVIVNIILPVLVKTQSTVEFYTAKNITIAGDKVFFLCNTNSFDQSRDQVDIYFGTELLLRFVADTTVYYNNERPADYYKTEIYESAKAGGPVGVGLSINAVHTSDSGDYFCIMTLSGEQRMSETIDLLVKTVPKPTCRVPNTTGLSYMTDGPNGDMIATEGVKANLICQINLNTNSIPVLLEWTRSDSGVMFQPRNTVTPVEISSVSVSIFSSDDNVVFTCTSKVSKPGLTSFTETCHINLHVTNESVGVSTMSPAGSEGEGLPLLLIIGVSGGLGVLCILLIIVIVCVCIRTSKTKRKGSQAVGFIDTDGNRDMNRLSVISNGYGNTTASDAIHSNEATYGNTGYSQEGVYENNEDEMYGNAQYATDIHANSNHATNTYGNTLHAQATYGNSDHAQPTYGNTEHEQAIYGNSDHAQEMYENTKNAQETYENTDYPQEMHENSDHTRFPNLPSGESDTSFPGIPVYSHVKKMKGAPSVVSDFSDDSIPTYAAVDRARGRKKAKSVSALAARRTSQYADVNDLPQPSSVRGINPRQSSSEYASVS